MLKTSCDVIEINGTFPEAQRMKKNLRVLSYPFKDQGGGEVHDTRLL